MIGYHYENTKKNQAKYWMQDGIMDEANEQIITFCGTGSDSRSNNDKEVGFEEGFQGNLSGVEEML
jgi:hypothetical protein